MQHCLPVLGRKLLVHFTLQCTFTLYNYTIQCKVYILQCSVYSVNSIMYSVQCKQYNIQCTLHSVQFIQNNVRCAMHIVHYTIDPVCCTLYSFIHTFLFTVHLNCADKLRSGLYVLFIKAQGLAFLGPLELRTFNRTGC